MPCSVAIDHVHLIEGTPQRLRVLGRAPGCLQVTLTTNPGVTTPASAIATPMLDGTGRFIFDVNLTQRYTCGATNFPTVTVSCSQKSDPNDTCQDAQWGNIPL